MPRQALGHALRVGGEGGAGRCQYSTATPIATPAIEIREMKDRKRFRVGSRLKSATR